MFKTQCDETQTHEDKTKTHEKITRWNDNSGQHKVVNM